MEELLRDYKSKNLIGVSGTEYVFSGLSLENYEYNGQPTMNGLFYIGKIDEDNNVIDQFDLTFSYDVYRSFGEYKANMKKVNINDMYHFFIYNGDDGTTLDNINIDLEKKQYRKSL